MFQLVSIVVLSCATWTNFDSYDPHRLDANLIFVRQHPDTCKEEPPQVLGADVTLEQCMVRAELSYLPQWMQKPENAHRVWLGVRCEKHDPQDEIMGETPP